jgi:hypothetical protein
VERQSAGSSWALACHPQEFVELNNTQQSDAVAVKMFLGCKIDATQRA